MTVEEIRNMKTESKISIWKNGRKEYVAEVVENCGCGFDYLIRVNPDYKDSLALFNKCLEICNIAIAGMNENFIEESIKRGYVLNHENIAVVLDKII